MIVKLDAQDIRFLVNRIVQYGTVRDLIPVILKELDASYTMPDGSRPRQTISYVWQRSNAEFHYLLNLLLDDNIDDNEYNGYIEQYNDVIAANKEYELANPPVVYDKKKRTVAKKVRVDNVSSMFNADETLKVGVKATKVKEKKLTAAEKKVINLNNKSVKFALNIFKPKE